MDGVENHQGLMRAKVVVNAHVAVSVVFCLIVVAFIACAGPISSGSAETNHDRAQVYAAVFDAAFNSDGPGSSVIRANTTELGLADLDLVNASDPSYPLWSSLIRGQVGGEQQVSLGERDSSLTFITSDEEAHTISNGRVGWSELFARYPKAKGILSFSEVVFDPGAQHALVYAFRCCGPECGGGGLYALDKRNGQWVVSQIPVRLFS